MVRTVNIRLLLFWILLVTAFSAWGGPAIVGVGGLNLSQLIYSEGSQQLSGDKIRFGFNAGALVEFPLSDFFAVTPGMMLETRGEAYEGYIMGFSYEAIVRLMYIQLPVMVKALIPAGPGKVVGSLGPELGICADADLYAHAFLSSDEEDISDDISNVDFSIGLHLGYEIPVGNHAIIVGTGYDMGFIDIVDVENQPSQNNNGSVSLSSGDDPTVKNSNFRFFTGFKLNLR